MRNSIGFLWGRQPYAGSITDAVTAPRAAHPAVYLALIIPFGVLSGYGSVTLGYALGQAGVTASGVAALVAVYFVPQTWKFLWAPVADLTLTRKRWYVLAAVLVALGFIAMGAIPPRGENLRLLSASMLVASTASTFLAMSVEALIGAAAIALFIGVAACLRPTKTHAF